MMIGSEDSRSPLGRPSSLVPPMTLQPLHSMCSGAVSPPQCFPAGAPTARHCQTWGRVYSTMPRCHAGGSLLGALLTYWGVRRVQLA